MAWNRKDARERIRKSYDDFKDLELKPLTREMDLRNLARNQARVVTGVHLYLDPVNFQELLKDAREDAAKLKKLLRHVHVYQRQIAWLLEDTDGAQRVHFQGGRLHAVFYKPYDTTDVAEPGVKRLSAAVQFVEQARELAQLLEAETDILFELEAGLECGESIATMNGRAGSSELLFIGPPANDAAKALTGKPGNRFCVNAENLREKLPKNLEPLPERYAKQVKDDVADNPISRFETFEPKIAIDYADLGIKTADLKQGVTFYGDISGFTRHIASLSTDEEKVEALRAFHATRSEMHHVVVADYNGDFIQYQGDRIQGLFYEAKTSGRFASKTIEAAAALQDAFDICRDELPGFSKLGMASGAAVGRVFVTQVGKKGDREVIVLGQSVVRASQLQDDMGAGQTAINASLWTLLKEEEQKLFQSKTGDEDVYVARLSMSVFDALEDAKLYAGRVRVEGVPSMSARVVSDPAGGVKPTKSWCPAK
jgi:class 3 adenylate cyclase